MIFLSFNTITSIADEPKNNIVLFEEYGRYAIATAGVNNAARSTAQNKSDYYLINDYPENFDNIKNNIPEEIISRINNMAGSELIFDGKIEKAWITISDESQSRYNGDPSDILIIKPDGSYMLIEDFIESEINITQPGWYYISILGADKQSQLAWGITALYSNENLPKKYIKIVENRARVTGGTIIESELYEQYHQIEIYIKPLVKFNTNKYTFFGNCSAGGMAGWPVSGQTEDILVAILEDGTYKQLYEDTYNGKQIFKGRTETDFFNGTFNTIRSHNIIGGEFDIFNEEIGKDYFDNKQVIRIWYSKIRKKWDSP